LKFCGCESLAGCSLFHFFSSVFGIHHLSNAGMVWLSFDFNLQGHIINTKNQWSCSEHHK
jgi:hypothetical protein